jgi:acyl-CoA reductase-like NAD-dependent aldehyde dehydrogenase
MSTAESSPATVLGMFVGGAWRPSASGETFQATSPVTGDVIGAIPQGDRSDAQAAVAAAAQAFPGWAAQTAFARAAALHRIADVCERRREELARALTLDQGKPLHAESYDEVDELLAMWRGAAEDGVRLEGSIPPSASPGKRVLLMRRPLGPVAVVTPWNWPYTMPAEIVAPALAAGNTVVWTPAPSTALCSALLAACVAEADLPPGVFNFVTGPGAVVGDEIVANPGTVAVGFIGSTAPTSRPRLRRRSARAFCARGRAARRASGCSWPRARATSSSSGWAAPWRRTSGWATRSRRRRRWARSTTRASPRRWTSTWATP